MRASAVVKRQSTRIVSRFALLLPRSCFPPQNPLVWNAAVQALAGQHPQFYLGPVQPAASHPVKPGG